MHRIIEAFTRAHDQVTGIDQLLMAIVILPVLLLILLIAYWAASKLDP